MVRSLGSIVAGIVVFSAALLAAMSAGNALLGTDPEWINLSTATQAVWLAWNVVAMMGGGYVAARVAPRAPIAHAVAMGALQTLFTAGALIGNGAGGTPLWLWIAGIALTIPAAFAGARLAGGAARRALAPS